MNEKYRLSLLSIFCLIFVCGIFIVETAFAGLMTIYMGIEIGSLIAFTIAGFNLMVFSAIVLDQLSLVKSTNKD